MTEFAMCISDALEDEWIDGRLSDLKKIYAECRSFTMLCIRNDTKSGDRLAEVKRKCEATWNGRIVTLSDALRDKNGEVIGTRVEAVNLKQCHEGTTALTRQGRDDLVVITWGGEYAFSMASLSVLKKVRYVVLDDLDPESCGILDRFAVMMG